MSVYRALLESSIFNEAVPGFFTGTHCADHLAEQAPRLLITTNTPRTRAFGVSSPRLGFARRVFSVINPETSSVVCGEMAENWEALDEKMNPVGYSTSAPVWDEAEDRIRSRVDFQGARNERIEKEALFQVSLRTDVTRFYPSIYTHSIAWAIEGKAIAKANHSTVLLGNRIDKAIQNCQEGQTNGIPIGPKFSAVGGELIMSQVDLALAEKLDGKANASRGIDDIHVYTWDRETAIRAQSIIQGVLADYNLELNPTKTGIHELPDQSVASWKLRMDGVRLDSEDVREQHEQALRLFSMARELAPRNPVESVMKEFVRRLAAFVPQMESVNVDRFQDLAFKAMAFDARATTKTIQLLKEMKEFDHELTPERLTYVVDALVHRARVTGYTYDLIWPLWLNRLYDGKISNFALDHLEKTPDPLVGCLVLLHEEQGLTHRHVQKETWQRALDQDPKPLASENWLLAHEGAMRDWLTVSAAKLAGNAFFEDLRESNVTFLDERMPEEILEEHY